MRHQLRRTALACAAAFCTTLALAGAAAGDPANGNLPGGTSISVDITSPADGAVFPQGTTVPIDGGAAVGTATPIKDTTVIFVIDRSGSMSQNAGVDCGGSPAFDTRLFCTQAAVNNAITAAEDPNSAVDLVGIASFSDTETAHDVGTAAGIQLLAAPGAMHHSVVNALIANGFTCYSCGMDAALEILDSPLNTNSKHLIVFLSDGENNRGRNMQTYVPPAGSFFRPGTIIKAFATGDDVSCSTTSTFGDLNDVAALRPGGSCAATTDFSAIEALIQDALGSTLLSLALTVDGGPAPATTTPALPLAGPASATFSSPSITPPPGTHTVCATASGSDGLGTGSVNHCHTFSIDAMPSVSVGDSGGPEGSPIGVSGTVTDPDSAPALSWTYAPVAGVDAGATCSFASPTSASTTITCTDDGEYAITLTADDGVNPAVAGSGTLTVANAAPQLSLTSPAAGTYQTGTPLTASGTWTDPGSNDTHTCSVNWGDATTTACGASHAYATGGTRTITMTVTDDDGASDAKTATVTINAPPSCSGVHPSTAVLWPPNGKLHTITLSGAADPDGNPLTLTVTGVRQDEAVAGPGGSRAPDAVAGATSNSVQLRAERDGGGDGRVYRIAYTVADGAGGTCSSTVDVTVPHSQNGSPAVNSGLAFDSFTP